MEDESPYNSKRYRYTRASTVVSPSNLPATSIEDQVDLSTLTSRQLALTTANEEQSFAFSLRLGLISFEPGKCPKCGHNMRLAKDAAQIGGYRFRCTKECGKSLSFMFHLVRRHKFTNVADACPHIPLLLSGTCNEGGTSMRGF